MKVFRKISKCFCGILATFMLAVMSFAPVAADDVPEYRIQMSPAREDIGDLKPGETYTGTFKIQNTGQKKFDYTVSIEPYFVIDEYYTSTFKGVEAYNDIVEWVKFSKTEGSLEPNSEDEIAYTVKVPADVPAGGQYAALIAEITGAEGETTSDGAGVAVRGQIGMQLFSNVEGNTRKTAKIEDNKIPSFIFNPPISATSVVENTGNTHTSANYVLQVYPLFGDEEVYTNEESPATLVVLPETRRFNTISWDGAPHIGIFRVKQTVTVFDETSTTEKLVFLCPIWLLFIILLAIFCAIFWIFTRIRARKQK